MRKAKDPPVTVTEKTVKTTRVEYSAEGLEELIREAVLKRCNIEDHGDLNVVVSLYADRDGEQVSGHVSIEETIA